MHLRSRDWVRLVEVVDRLLQRRAGDLRASSAGSEGLQAGKRNVRRRRLEGVIAEERWGDLPHAIPQAENVVVRQRRPGHLGERTAANVSETLKQEIHDAHTE